MELCNTDDTGVNRGIRSQATALGMGMKRSGASALARLAKRFGNPQQFGMNDSFEVQLGNGREKERAPRCGQMLSIVKS